MNEENDRHAVAVVGLGAILPDAPDVAAFWRNVTEGRYSISEVPEGRWDPCAYYDPDPTAPDKTYSKIGGWVRDWEWDPLAWHLPVPPTVGAAMDDGQKWAIACTHAALADYGLPGREIDGERTAVILGNAMAGELHYLTALRIYFPEFADELERAPSFEALPEEVRDRIVEEMHAGVGERFPRITEDTMPGELGNIIAGRVANLFDFNGPNFIVDAACASAMAAFSAACEGLADGAFDLAISGGIDRNMGASAFIKFCKIGALSATGTRPYGEGADGFVMGEGAGVFVLKRFADAERDGDRIYAVVRALAGSSDGRGKAITAPNPLGQRLAVERAWLRSGLSPATATMVEGHGTSTKVGDVVEVHGLNDVFGDGALAPGSIALGSVKSNIGHLKAAAGAAGLMKTVLALHHKVLPPTLHAERRNPDIDFEHSALRPNTELRDWIVPVGHVRRAGVSAFGFGGTNFHAVLEEYVPGRPLDGNGHRGAVAVAVPGPSPEPVSHSAPGTGPEAAKAPLRGATVIGAANADGLIARLTTAKAAADAGHAPAASAPQRADLDAPERIAIDFADARELSQKADLALKAFGADDPAAWRMLRARGVFRGHGPVPKVAFLYPGQGSQYADMLGDLRRTEPIVAQVFDEADRVMEPLLGRPLSELIFVDRTDPAAVAAAEEQLKQTAITQPAVLAVDAALTRLLAAYGIRPDVVMGHSLGEYAALTAAGALSFGDALEAVSARGREMTSIHVDDAGAMAAVFAPIGEVERIVGTSDGYVEIANFNSTTQSVIGGATDAVLDAVARCTDAGFQAVPLPVSHAFHTAIVAPASEPLRAALIRLNLRPPELPIVANVTGELYPMGSDVVPEMLDMLARQVASPVQFVKGLQTLYAEGVRLFVEAGPKKALQGFVDDVLGGEGDVASLFANHPKVGDVASFNQALCGLYAAGLGRAIDDVADPDRAPEIHGEPIARKPQTPRASDPAPSVDTELDGLFAEFLERDRAIFERRETASPPPDLPEPIVITGAALGLPGTERIFDDDNVRRILDGEVFIDHVPERFRQAILDKHIRRLVKSEDGQPTFELIEDAADVIKLAARGGALDLEVEFGISAERVPALDRSTRLAVGAGIDALRDAGLPLVLHYKDTTTGRKLPDRWGLPDALRDDTGVIFASAFPGLDSFVDDLNRYHADRARREELRILGEVRGRMSGADPTAIADIDRRIHELRVQIEEEPFHFDRRFLFKALSMGHSQFAEIVGARGPNMQINSACASTTQAVALAEDWIRADRCRRVVIVAGDDATSDNLMEWILAGFLSSGAAATDDVVADAAIPFDRRRHGMIVGMGAAALIVEAADAARERGIRPICQVLGAVSANSAFHGTRLDVHHISQVMEGLVSSAERRWGIDRQAIAAETMFVSHETYTPARGGSAAAEVEALRSVFGADADSIVVANTKGFTGHPMGVGIEDVVAVKALETGIVPPVPNFKEVDPDLGALNLSKGGSYPVRYALRLAAGFGSQIAMTLTRWVPSPDGSHRAPDELGFDYRIEDRPAWDGWLAAITGRAGSELEVTTRQLRVKDDGHARTVVTPPTVEVVTPVALVTPASPVPVAPQPVARVTAPSPVPVAPEPVAVTEATAPVTAEAAAEPAAVPAAADDGVQEHVLALVAGKTGYPSDMLDLDLDLEADLGVDTVKQAEIFATIREDYGIERDDTLKLRDFPTIAHVIGFVHDRATGMQVPVAPLTEVTAPVTAEAAAEPAAVPAAADDGVQEHVLALVAGKTGYPSDMLDLDLDLEADLGVDTVKQAEIFATIREDYGIERDDTLKLRDFPTIAHVIGFVHDRATGMQVPVAPLTEVTAPVTAEAAAEPAAVPAAADDGVQEHVLALVAGKTGYPSDMLDLDLDLEADLGVDTVKQAEIFATIREDYGIERDDTLKLRDFPTIAHVIGFVHDRATGMQVPVAPLTEVTAPVTAEAAAEPAAVPAAADDGVQEHVLALVAGKTGYPSDMLDLDLDLEADLGVDTVKQAEIFATIREDYGIERDDTLKLRDFPTIAHVIGFVHDRATGMQVPVAPLTEVTAPVTAEAAAEPAAVPAAADDGVQEHVLALVAGKTGYPSDMLDLDLDLEADLGVDTVKQAEIFATIREDYGIERDDTLKLRDFPTIAHVIGFVHDRATGMQVPVAPLTEVTAPVTAEAAAEPAAVPAAADDGVQEHVLALVAGKTGYPSDMLDLDLDLEADLGVDTVKQAEIFATIREDYGIERDDTLKLRDFPTIAHVIGFVHDRATGMQVPGTAAPGDEATDRIVVVPEATPGSTASAEATSGFDAADRMPRRVPIPVLRPDLDRCLPSGVSLGPDSRVVVMPDGGGVADALIANIERAGAQALVLDPADGADGLEARLREWLTEGPVQGCFWLPALDAEEPFADLDLEGWRAALTLRVKLLAGTARALYEAIGPPETFLVAATRLGGFHGYDDEGATAPLGGAVSGFTKAFGRERPEALVKVVDFPIGADPAEVADAILEETLGDPGAVEVGRHGGARWTIGLDERPAADGGAGLTFGPDTVFVVTGAAGSIVSAIVSDLAAASGGTFHLLDLAPEPDRDDPDLARFATDRDGLKRDLFDRIQTRGERATPALVERELANLERAHAALDAIRAIEAAGGAARYHSLDLRDGDAVAAAIDDVRTGSGRVDVLLHAAGLEISRFLPEKSQEEFDRVFDVKADGWFNVLHAIGDMPLAATVAFSSVAGRFGNGGQTDYSAANALLCATTSGFRRTRPDTRGIAIDWTAWGGIGMATRGSIPKMMELAGIEMLPPESGIPTIRRELVAGATRGEIVVAGALGGLTDERHPTGGLDLGAMPPPAGVMTGTVTGFGVHSGLTIETELDPTAQPFLDDHRIDGTPVLPGVMGVETFAAAASLGVPSHRVIAIEDVRFLAPCKFYRDEPRTLTVRTTFTRDGDDVLAVCSLLGVRSLAGQDEPQVTTHFTGRVRLRRAGTADGELGTDGAAAASIAALVETNGQALVPDDVYAVYFHGPAYRVVGKAWRVPDGLAAAFATGLPPATVPAEAALVTSPRLLELCFQAAGLWELGTAERLALPTSIEQVSFLQPAGEPEGSRAVVRPRGDGSFDGDVIAPDGRVLVRLTGYQGTPVPAPIEAPAIAPIVRAMS